MSKQFGMVLGVCALVAGSAVAQESQPTSQPARPGLPALGAPAGTYGAGVDMGETTPLAELAEDPAAFEGETVLVEAGINEICQKKGCWMLVEADAQLMRVRFVDYGFFVPRDAGGRRTLVQGTFSVTEISEEVARHYAEESGHPERAAEIHGPQEILAFMATGVEILGSDALPAQAEAEGEAMATVTARITAGQPLAEGAGPVDDAEAALGVLRSVPVTRTLEFALYADAGDHWVFGCDPAEPFAGGFAVEKSTGVVVGF